MGESGQLRPGGAWAQALGTLRAFLRSLHALCPPGSLLLPVAGSVPGWVMSMVGCDSR